MTARARSRPAIGGSAAISSRASASPIVAGEDAAEHRARLADVAHERARVDAGDPGEPQSSSQSSQPRSALGASSALTASRMIAARAWTRSDSIAAALTP